MCVLFVEVEGEAGLLFGWVIIKPCLPLTLLTYFILEGRSYQKNPDKILEKSQPGRTPSLFIQSRLCCHSGFPGSFQQVNKKLPS